MLALLYVGGEHDIDSSGDGSEQSDHPRELQHIIDTSQGPVILSGKKQVKKQNDDKREDHACQEDLNW
jgi:hypothetical protein